jgi:hypothetical protein
VGVTRINKMFNRTDGDGVVQKGVFDVSRSKFYADYVLTNPAKPNITGTDIPRLRLVYLGVKSVAVDDDDTVRVVAALQDFYASKAAQRRASTGKKKNPPPWLTESAR